MDELEDYFPVASSFANVDIPQKSLPDSLQPEYAKQFNLDAGHVVTPTIETETALINEIVE